MLVPKYSGDCEVVATAAELAAIITTLGDNIQVDVEPNMPTLDIIGDDDGVNLRFDNQGELTFIETALTIAVGRPIVFNPKSRKFTGFKRR
jgi:hypothetical protein